VHILTKIFVLAAAVLSMGIASLAISYSVNADRILDDYEKARERADAAESELAASQAIGAQEKATLEEDNARLQDELASRDAELRRLEASNTELRIALRQAESERVSIASRIAQLGVTTQTQAKIIEEYKNELSRLRTAELNYRDEKIDLEKKLGDLESQVIVFEQVKRALEEQLAEIRRATNPATARVSDERVARATEVPGPPISGRIDEVRRDPNSDDTLVKINLGTNDRITNNTRMYVHRGGDRYLGELVVIEADLNHAVARVSYSVSGQTIREGDGVLSRLGS